MRSPLLLPLAGVFFGLLLTRCGGSFGSEPADSGAGSDARSPQDSASSSDGPAPGDATPLDGAAAQDATQDATQGVDGAPDATLDGSAIDAATQDAAIQDAAPDAATCAPGCGVGRTCCDGRCINPNNDPLNCGGCNVRCGGATPFCDGTCKPLACGLPGGCPGGGICCGTSCCTAPGSICCKTEGPVATAPVCFVPTAAQTTCPQGCAPMCVSDRNLKRDVAPADERAVLEAVGRMPVSTWSYQTDPARTRHIGPMAQDFHAAFGVGNTPLAYDPIDAHGVELASIKALYGLVQEQNARIERLERENRGLRQSAGVCGATPANAGRDRGHDPRGAVPQR